MKKNLTILVLALLSIVLVSCKKDPNLITVVATENPHVQILEQTRDILKEEGYKLKIIATDDYFFGNPEVEKGRADANFFQHVPFFNDQNVNGKLVNLGAVHLEPIGLYGGSISNIDDLKDGDTILVSTNQPDYGRIAAILADLELVSLVDDFDPLKTYNIVNQELTAVASKKVDFKIKAIDGNLLTAARASKDGALLFINGNYAVTGGLGSKDALHVESPINNPYVNILVAKKEDVDSLKLQALLKALQSNKIKEFINSNYDNLVIPA